MNITTMTPEQLSAHDVRSISTTASRGFMKPDDAAMLDDTTNHIQQADYIQLAVNNEALIGFAMYRRCLWRYCD
jgi:hypothetical protein